MSNHTTTTVPTEEPVDSSAENSTDRDGPFIVRQAQAADDGPIQYVFPRGVRITVTMSSVCLLVTGLLLIVLGGIGKGGGFMQGLSGLNTIVTGISLVIAGTVGCMVVFASRNGKVGRIILVVLVSVCHASGAFAVQCAIIAGQMASRQDPCEDSPFGPEDDAIGTATTPTFDNICNPDTTRMALSILILILSVVGFVLGIVCSAFCYSAAPRIWCCLCDGHAPKSHQSYSVEPIPTSAQQREPNAA